MDTDWTSILWNKINWLQTVGLVPWYAYGQAAPSSTPETSANSSSGWVHLLLTWQGQPSLLLAAASCTCLLAVATFLQQSGDSTSSSPRDLHDSMVWFSLFCSSHLLHALRLLPAALAGWVWCAIWCPASSFCLKPAS